MSLSSIRSIKHHEVDKLNERIQLVAMDEPGSGGANHHYLIYIEGRPVTELRFQKGPLKKAGYNGISNKALLSILIDRMEGFINGPYPSEETEQAHIHLMRAMEALHSRTRERISRGVEGTHQK